MMKRSSTLLLTFSLVLLFNVINPKYVPAQKLSAVPVDLEVPFAPAPVKANGKTHLVYELHITNFRPRNLELTRLEVLADDVNTPPLASYQNLELINKLGRPGTTADLADKRLIGGGMRAVVFLQVTVDTDPAVPGALRHRLFFKSNKPDNKGGESVVEGARIVIHRITPLVIGSPLRGEGWLAGNGMSNTSEHRRTLMPLNGKARIAQRFAIDWVKLGPDGRLFHGQRENNANWYGYGAEVLAVANAVVVEVKDGIPENDLTSDETAVPVTLETIGGNYLILDLGKGFFAFYAHLQPKSIRVRVGDRVRRGQILALLGNSGNSDAPHLHFHVTDTSSPLGAEGLPYVFESFEVQGSVKSLKVVESSEGWKPQPNTLADKRRKEIPVENTVVRFH